MIANQLTEGKIPFVVVDRVAERVAEARESGWLTLQGEATDESVPAHGGDRPGPGSCHRVLPDDAANVFITLSARNMNPSVQIIARGEVPARSASSSKPGRIAWSCPRTLARIGSPT